MYNLYKANFMTRIQLWMPTSSILRLTNATKVFPSMKDDLPTPTPAAPPRF